MKRILIFTLVLSYFVGNAQNIELLYNGNVVGDTLEIEVENLLTRNDIYIDIVNLSTRPVDVKVRKTELSILEGTENSFCFGTYCFETNESHVAFTIPAQDTFSHRLRKAQMRFTSPTCLLTKSAFLIFVILFSMNYFLRIAPPLLPSWLLHQPQIL